MGQEQRRRLRTAAGIVEDAARIADEATAKVNELIAANNQNAELIAKIQRDLDSHRDAALSMRAALTKRIDAQGQMHLDLEKRLETYADDFGKFVGRRDEHGRLVDEPLIDHIRATDHVLMGALREIERIERTRLTWRRMSFWQRLRWFATGREPLGGSMVPVESAGRGTSASLHETLTPNPLFRGENA